MQRLSRCRAPLLIYALSTLVYCAVLGPRLTEPSPDNHFVHLAAGWLDGRLGLEGAPPGYNDWACFDTELSGPCPPNRFAASERYRWFVSFPPFPGLVILPAVALFGLGVLDRLFWALIAGLGPSALYLLLRRLREDGVSDRSAREDVSLALLFAFGSVFFFTAVQGTVWFAAHVVATPLICLYLYAAFGARRPVLAGVALGCLFLTRPTTALLCAFMAVELLRRHRVADAPSGESDAHPMVRFGRFVRGTAWGPALRGAALFSAPILVAGAVAMALNSARFGDPFEFGHTYLQIRWRGRIETWGLFNYHYLGRNLSVFLASLPWFSAEPPYVTISRHGLALWYTTPALLWVLAPKRMTAALWALLAGVLPVMLLDLMYQNSGWVQFGYRFALDYLPLLFVMIALGGRRFRVGFYGLMVFAVVVNTFGALTFDRAWQYYDRDATQRVLHQPD